MATDKPLVTILMAIYKPNEEWFVKQLRSLNEQTYENLELLVYNDCPDVPADENLIAGCVKAFPYRIVCGGKNMGSNKAFERLTEMGEGKYFSYCDQDDVWYPDKIRRMVDVLETTGSPLVCSDLAIIDGEDKKIADSITEVRKRHVYYEGEGLAAKLLIRNFVTGCAMLMRADVAKKAVPFVDSLVHDQWLAIIAALNGKIEVIHEPLINYRQHQNNQTGVLKGVFSKKDYYEARIGNMRDRIADYEARLTEYPEIMETVRELKEFNEARDRYATSHKAEDRRIMKRYKDFAREDVMIETIMPFLPECIVGAMFKIIKKGVI